MHIGYLADHLHWAPTLAQWHHLEWGAILPDWSLADALGELQSHTGRCMIPTTLIGFEDDRLLGSVSLVEEDAPELSDATPWLASLYVAPGRRGEGIGRALVQRAVAEAARLGVRRLHLYTPHHEGYYLGLGWHLLGRVRLARTEVSVLWIDPALWGSPEPARSSPAGR